MRCSTRRAVRPEVGPVRARVLRRRLARGARPEATRRRPARSGRPAPGPDAATISRHPWPRPSRFDGAAEGAGLLDQSRVAGVGNLIADEVLWRARLSPLRPAGSLTPAEVRRLHRQLLRTIGDLADRGGSHLGDLMEERRPGGRCPRDGTELVRSDGRGPDVVVVPVPPGVTGGPRPGDQSASSARTFSAWPSAFTWYQGRAILPSGPMRKVDRMTPTDFLP